MPKRTYLSGPMTGYPNFNYDEFERVATMLRQRGWVIESPHENPAPKLLPPCKHEASALDCSECKDEAIWQYYMDLGDQQVKRCDSIIMLPGWPESRGARLELDWAVKLNHRVYFFDSERGIISRMSRFDHVRSEEGTSAGV